MERGVVLSIIKLQKKLVQLTLKGAISAVHLDLIKLLWYRAHGLQCQISCSSQRIKTC